MATAKKALIKKSAAKKANPAKAAKKAGTPEWNTIHIFGYGETQIIGSTHSVKVANT